MICSTVRPPTPTLTQIPPDVALISGTTTILACNASFYSNTHFNVSYGLYQDGVLGWTSPTGMFVTNVTFEDIGSYVCTVTAGSVTSLDSGYVNISVVGELL